MAHGDENLTIPVEKIKEAYQIVKTTFDQEIDPNVIITGFNFFELAAKFTTAYFGLIKEQESLVNLVEYAEVVNHEAYERAQENFAHAHMAIADSGAMVLGIVVLLLEEMGVDIEQAIQNRWLTYLVMEEDKEFKQ